MDCTERISWAQVVRNVAFPLVRPGELDRRCTQHGSFLENLRRSYRASLRNFKFSWTIGVLQLIFNWVWVYDEVNKTRPITIWQLMTLKISFLVWSCAACLFTWTVWLFHKLKNELASVQRIQSEWHESNNELPSRPMREREPPGFAFPLIAHFLEIAAQLTEGLDTRFSRRKKNSWRFLNTPICRDRIKCQHWHAQTRSVESGERGSARSRSCGETKQP